MESIEFLKILWSALAINLLLVFYPLFFLPLKKIWKKVNLKRDVVKNYMTDGTLEREINLNYSPAFISLLIDRNVEPHKDLIADLLNLIYKKIVNVNLENQYKILSINYENMKKFKISKEENMIIDYIDKVNRGIKEKFDFEKFEQAVRKQFIEEGFDNENKVKKYLIAIPKLIMYGIRNWAVLILMVTVIWAFIFLFILMLPNKLFDGIIFGAVFAYGSIIVGALFILFIFKWLGYRLKNIIKPPIILSEKGKEEYKKILKFKYFLDEYTLIKDKEVKHMAVLDWYIPYAIAVNTNKGYKKDIEKVLNEFNIEKVYLEIFEYELKKEYII